MSISSGYDKFKDYHQTEDGNYKLTSRWTSSNTVELDDGSTVEEKFAETDSKLSENTENIENLKNHTHETDTTLSVEGKAADAKAVGNAIGIAITQLNNDLVKVSKGYESEVISNCVHTEGIYTIAGLKGFWYKAVDTTNKVIYLTNERTMTEDGIYYTWLNQESEAESLNYSDNAVGKLLSVCNDEKFEYALKITSLEPGKIYYELVGDDDPFKTQEQISVDEVNRDDFSVWCHDCYNEGNVDLGYAAHAEGSKSKATNKVAHAEGMYTHAYGQFSHAEGSETRADYAAHAEGRGTEALAVYAHSEGYFTKAIGNGSHAEGKRTTAYASQSHAEGSSSIAMGLRSHAEGTGNVASSQLNGIDLPKLSTSAVRKLWEEAKYTDGDGVEQTATYTDINGVEQTLEVKSLNIAVGESSHVEGSNNLAYGEHSHAEGYRNIAFGVRSHAEGNKTTANGLYSHTEGWYSIANGDYQHVQGKYNIEDTENKYANIIGNGKSLTKRSNAHTVDWNGNAWYAGDVYTGGTGQDDTATKKLATEEYVETTLNAQRVVIDSVGYDTGADGHCYLLLCKLSISGFCSAVLTITSCFWGNQHGSGDIIFVQADSNYGYLASLYRTHLGGKGGNGLNRPFYYKIADGYVYIYVYVNGGNQHGVWDIRLTGGNGMSLYKEGSCTEDAPSDITEIPLPQLTVNKNMFTVSNGELILEWL